MKLRRPPKHPKVAWLGPGEIMGEPAVLERVGPLRNRVLALAARHRTAPAADAPEASSARTRPEAVCSAGCTPCHDR